MTFQKELIKFRQNLRVLGEDKVHFFNQKYTEELDKIQLEKLEIFKNETSTIDQINASNLDGIVNMVLTCKLDSLSEDENKVFELLFVNSKVKDSFINFKKFRDIADYIRDKIKAPTRSRSSNHNFLDVDMVLPPVYQKLF